MYGLWLMDPLSGAVTLIFIFASLLNWGQLLKKKISPKGANSFL